MIFVVENASKNRSRLQESQRGGEVRILSINYYNRTESHDPYLVQEGGELGAFCFTIPNWIQEEDVDEAHAGI